MLVSIRHGLLYVLILIIAVGCAEIPMMQSVTGPEVEALWQQRQAGLRNIKAWAIKARLGIKTSQDGGSATLHWAQQAHLYKMRIIAPFGQGTFEIKGGHGKVSLLTDKNELIEASDPDTLMMENLGWSVPVLGLQYWVLGLPDPDSTATGQEIDASGRLIRLQQNGWDISFTRYQTVGDKELPDKLTLENQDIRVRLVIQDWVKVI